MYTNWKTPRFITRTIRIDYNNSCMRLLKQYCQIVVDTDGRANTISGCLSFTQNVVFRGSVIAIKTQG